MSKNICAIAISLIGGLTAPPIMAASQPVTAMPAAARAAITATDPTSSPLSGIPQLQQKIIAAATDRPIGDVLTGLSPSLPVDLSAERDVADQRVTLHVTDQPTYLVMDRLVRLLSHHADIPQGYHWRQLDRDAGARPGYQLWRDGHSVNEEKSALDYPQREMAVLLRDIRNMAGMSQQDLAAYKSDYPYKMGDPSNDMWTKAFRGLSDAQLDALMAGQGVLLDPSLFTAEIGAQRQKQIDEQQGKSDLAQMNSAAVRGLPANSQDLPMMYVTPVSDDADRPAQASADSYLITLQGVTNDSLLVDTHDTNQSRSPYRSPQPAPSGPLGPPVDLSPMLMAKGVTRAQRNDVGFTLQVLARAAHISVYQEEFLRSSATFEQTNGSNVGLTVLKAPLPVLIATICAHWDYQWQKVGGDYLFWSRTWAQDRADDVPERLIGPWRGRLQKNGYLSLDDQAEMAATLTYPQVSLTLAVALPESGPWTSSSYSMLHFIGQLAPGQERQAFSGDGIPLATLLPWQQEALASGFKQQLQNASYDQLSRAVVTLQAEDDSQMSLQRVILTGTADGKHLFGTRFIIPMPKTPTSAGSVSLGGG